MLSRTFLALRNPLFRTLWSATMLFHLGQQMQVLARGYLAFDLTGKNSALGAVMLAYGVPQLLLAAPGGIAADRFSKRTVLCVAEATMVVSTAWMAAMVVTDLVAFWMLVVASGIQGSAFAFIVPSRQSYVAELVERDQLGNAIVLQSLAQASTRVVGPSVAGALIGIYFIGVGGVYLASSVLVAIAAGTLLLLPPGKSERAVRQSALADWNEGLRYVLQRPAILQLTLVFFSIVVVAFNYTSFLPSLAKAEYGAGASGLGWLSSANAVGAVVAGLAIATVVQGRRAWHLQPVLAAAFACSIIGLGLAPSFAVGLVVLVLVGGLASAFQSLNNSLLMLLTPREYQGRVQSISFMAWGVWGLATLPIGLLADAIGLRETMVLMGATSLLFVGGVQVVGRLTHAAEDRFTRQVPVEPAGAPGS
jgi:MFS family permease